MRFVISTSHNLIHTLSHLGAPREIIAQPTLIRQTIHLDLFAPQMSLFRSPAIFAAGGRGDAGKQSHFQLEHCTLLSPSPHFRAGTDLAPQNGGANDKTTASEAKGREERRSLPPSLPQDNLVRAAHRQHSCCQNNTMSDSFEELVATDGRTDGRPRRTANRPRARKNLLLVLLPG